MLETVNTARYTLFHVSKVVVKFEILHQMKVYIWQDFFLIQYVMVLLFSSCHNFQHLSPGIPHP